MNKIFESPQRYVQGKGVLKESYQYLSPLGNKAVILTDPLVWEIAGKDLEAQLNNKGMSATTELFQGESSINEIERLTAVIEKENYQLVIGLGGGKAIDTAKAVSSRTNSTLAILPTSAATDAPTSAISVLYTEEGLFEKYLFYPKHPELVLLDTAVISQAPVRLLKSGIADAMATWIEARAVFQAGGENLLGGIPTLAAVAIAEKCEEILFNYSLPAIAANEAKIVTKALDAVIEANTLLSGIGFESGGLGAAHAIHNGFSALKGEIHQLTHGEKVAYGTLVQLFLENRSTEELDKYLTFYQKIGLPRTLKELHLEHASYDELLKVGKLTVAPGSTIHQLAGNYTAEEITDALIAVDAYVKLS